MSEQSEKTPDEMLNEFFLLYLLIRERSMGTIPEDPEFNFNEAMILEVIYRGISFTMSDIARFLAINNGIASFTMKKLEQKGLIAPAPQNGLSKPMGITQKGKEALLRTRHEQSRGSSAGEVLFSNLVDVEKIFLKKMLQKILGNKDLLAHDNLGTNGGVYRAS